MGTINPTEVTLKTGKQGTTPWETLCIRWRHTRKKSLPLRNHVMCGELRHSERLLEHPILALYLVLPTLQIPSSGSPGSPCLTLISIAILCQGHCEAGASLSSKAQNLHSGFPGEKTFNFCLLLTSRTQPILHKVFISASRCPEGALPVPCKREQ